MKQDSPDLPTTLTGGRNLRTKADLRPTAVGLITQGPSANTNQSSCPADKSRRGLSLRTATMSAAARNRTATAAMPATIRTEPAIRIAPFPISFMIDIGYQIPT